MLKLLNRLFRRAPSICETPAADWIVQESWWRDPLSHPDVSRMSQRQLGDLPIDPRRIRPHF